jgi:hypothetical protein
MREAVASLVELMRRLGSATAEGATAFLFSDQVPTKKEEGEEQHSHKSLDVPADSGEVKDLEHARDSAIDSISQELTEAMDNLGAQHGQGSAPHDIPHHDHGMHHSR